MNFSLIYLCNWKFRYLPTIIYKIIQVYKNHIIVIIDNNNFVCVVLATRFVSSYVTSEQIHSANKVYSNHYILKNYILMLLFDWFDKNWSTAAGKVVKKY